MRTTLLALALAVAPGLLAFSPARAEAPRAQRLSVAAAASLKPALEPLVQQFQQAHPGLKVEVTYGASGIFFAQLRQGAPFDLFFSADRDYPRQLVKAGLAAAGDERVYAVGRLVLWVSLRSGLDPALGLPVLLDDRVRRVAIANPAVAPYGRAAEAALLGAGLHARVKPKLVLGGNVSQAAQFAQSGAADAAILPLSTAQLPQLRLEGRFAELPPGSHPRQEQSLVILKRARERGSAEALVAFVLGPAGQQVLAGSGYGVP